MRTTLDWISSLQSYGQKLRKTDTQGSIDLLTKAIADLIDRQIFPDVKPEALAVLLNGAMIDGALWISSQPNQEASLSSAAQALEQLIRQLAKHHPLEQE